MENTFCLTSWKNWSNYFTTSITTDWMRHWDRHDNCSLQEQLEKDLLLSAAWNRHSCNWVEMKQLAPDQETVIFIVILRPLCPTGSETHHTSTSLSMALTVMAAYTEVTPVLHCLFVHSQTQSLRANNSRAVSEQSKGSCLFPSFGSWDGTVSEASRFNPPCRGHATLSQDGVRSPPGRAAPQVLLSPPALQLSWESYELLAPLLTESV